MVQFDFPCCIFYENESEEFQNFLEMVDAFHPDRAHPKFNDLLKV